MEGILEAATAAAKKQLEISAANGQGIDEVAAAVAAAVLTEALGKLEVPAVDQWGYSMNERIIPADTVRNHVKAALLIVLIPAGRMMTGMEQGLIEGRLRGASSALDAAVMIG